MSPPLLSSLTESACVIWAACCSYSPLSHPSGSPATGPSLTTPTWFSIQPLHLVSSLRPWSCQISHLPNPYLGTQGCLLGRGAWRFRYFTGPCCTFLAGLLEVSGRQGLCFSLLLCIQISPHPRSNRRGSEPSMYPGSSHPTIHIGIGPSGEHLLSAV